MHFTSTDIARLHAVWYAMQSRCNNTTWKQYDDYGGRGIRVDSVWDDPDEFIKWCAVSGYNSKLTLDRINNNSNYGPNNCRWATRQEQVDNRRNTIYLTAWGETKRMNEWASDSRCAVRYNTLAYRIRTGWDHERAISLKPPRSINA